MTTASLEELNKTKIPSRYKGPKQDALIYVRLPQSLKDAIEDLAKDQSITVNRWCIEALEMVAMGQKDYLEDPNLTNLNMSNEELSA